MAAAQSARTHCPQGHEYNEANTCRSGGRRSCLQCAKDRRAARRPPPASPREFILARVVETGECWVWTGAMHREGYGVFGATLAHRVAYEAFIGEIPAGLTIDHLCRNRACVNPIHLEPTTLPVNVMRGESPPARNARKTHCPQGHPYDDVNTHITSKGWRSCKACNRDRARRRRQGG